MRNLLSASLILAVGALAARGYSQSVPTLDKPFTLKYKGVIRNLTTSEMIEDSLRDFAADFAEDVKKGRRTQEWLDENLRKNRERLKENRPIPVECTLSYDGSALLYHLKPEAEGPTAARREAIVLIKDGKTFSRVLNGTGVQYESLLTLGMADMPWVGSSLPFLPLVKSGKLLSTYSGPTGTDRDKDRLTYVEGQILRQPPESETVSGLKYGPPGKPGWKYELEEPKKVHGVPVASMVTVTKPYNGSSPSLTGLPYEQLKFTLTEASEEPLAPEFFKVETYVRKGDDLQVTAIDGSNQVFTNNPAKGSLERQAQLETERQRISQTRSQRSGSEATLYGGASLLAMLGVGALVYRHSRSR